MKIGDKLYELILWEDWGRHQFQVYTHTITKINPKTIKVWGYDNKISKWDIGEKYFTSKKAMYKYYIKKYKEAIQPTLKGIRQLEKRINNLERKNA